MKNILITRSKNRSRDLASYLDKQGYKIFFQPLFSISRNLSKECFNYFKTTKNTAIIITSSSAIFALKKLIHKNFISSDTTIFAVGRETALKAKELGFNNIFYPQNPSAQNLCDIILNHKTKNNFSNMCYLRGEKISFDFKVGLINNNINLKEIIVYKTKSTSDLLDDVKKLIEQRSFEEILIFSQNSLDIFYKLAVKNNLIEYLNKSSILCFSDKITLNAIKIGFKNSQVFHNNILLNKFYDRAK